MTIYKETRDGYGFEFWAKISGSLTEVIRCDSVTGGNTEVLGLNTDTIKTKTASGTLTFKNQGGSTIGSITDAGVWSIPSILTVTTPTTNTDIIQTKTLDGVLSFKNYNGIITVGSYDKTGAWTIGPAGALTHIFNGRYIDQISTSDSVYRLKAYSTGISGIQMAVGGSAVSAYVCTSGAAGDIITGGSAGDLNLRVDNKNILFSANSGNSVQGKVDSNGSWILGPTGSSSSSLMHTINMSNGDSFGGTNFQNQPSGSIRFANGTSSGHTPCIIGKTSAALPALGLNAAGPDNNTYGDMSFNVRQNNNGDFSTLTNKAFSFERFNVTLGSVRRDGTWTLGNATAGGHSIRCANSGTFTGLLIQGSVSTGQHVLDIGYGSGTPVNGIYPTHNTFGYVTDAGLWTIGNNINTTTAHTISGPVTQVGIGVGMPGSVYSIPARISIGVGGGSGVAFMGMETNGGGGGVGFIFSRGGSYDTAVQVYTNTSGAGTQGGLSTAGPYVSAGSIAWASPSDERIKDIIEPIENVCDKLINLRTVVYKYKTDDIQMRRLGLIAQDVKQVFPEVVTEKHDEIKTLNVSYTELVPVLVKAIQENINTINELKARLEILEQK